MLATLHHAAYNPHRIESYLPFAERYGFETLTFPLPWQAIAPFAKRNSITINVYSFEEGKRVFFPRQYMDDGSSSKHIDLLMHSMGCIQHYSVIRSFNRLLSGQTVSNGTFFCRRCMDAYSSQVLLDIHYIHCTHVQHTKLPKDAHKQLPAPFTVYADFESVLKPLSGIDTTQVATSDEGHSSVPYQEHIACSFSYKIVSSVMPTFDRPIVYYRGEDAAAEFIRELQREAEELCSEFIESPQEMEFTEENEVHFECAQVCHIC